MSSNTNVSFRQEGPKITMKQGKEAAPDGAGLTLLDKLGGADKMIALMDEFYSRVLADPQLARFFENIDVVKLKRHSLNIIATAFSPDAPPSDDGGAPLIQDIPAYLTRTHKNLFEKQGHTEEHFDLFVGHFGGTMESVGVETETMQEAKEKLLKFRIVFEQGAQNAEAKKKKKRDSKVHFSSEVDGKRSVQQSIVDFYVRSKDVVAAHLPDDPKWKAVGTCVAVVGIITTVSVILRKQRQS